VEAVVAAALMVLVEVVAQEVIEQVQGHQAVGLPLKVH